MLLRSIPREEYTSTIAIRELELQLQDKRYTERAIDIDKPIRMESGIVTA